MVCCFWSRSQKRPQSGTGYPVKEQADVSLPDKRVRNLPCLITVNCMRTSANQFSHLVEAAPTGDHQGNWWFWNVFCTLTEEGFCYSYFCQWKYKICLSAFGERHILVVPYILNLILFELKYIPFEWILHKFHNFTLFIKNSSHKKNKRLIMIYLFLTIRQYID